MAGLSLARGATTVAGRTGQILLAPRLHERRVHGSTSLPFQSVFVWFMSAFGRLQTWAERPSTYKVAVYGEVALIYVMAGTYGLSTMHG